MLGLLIDNMLCLFGCVLQQTVGISMSTNCAPLLADLFLYLYEADCIHSLLMKNKKKLVLSFNSTFCYIDDVLSISNSKLGDFVDHLYPVEIEIKSHVCFMHIPTNKS